MNLAIAFTGTETVVPARCRTGLRAGAIAFPAENATA